MEELQKKWDYGTTPEGKREFVAFFVRSMKKQGKLPPDIDHLWFNLPSGWAEYTEKPAKTGQEAQSYTVTLGTAPTQEQWDEYHPDLQAKMGLDHGIGHFMLFEVDSAARAPAPPIPKSP